jgi:hypothetical protein
MAFFKTIKGVLTKPKGFFKAINKEKGIKQAYLYFIAFSLFANLFIVPYYLKVALLEASISSYIIVYILLSLINLGFIFVSVGIIHLFVLMVGGRKGFYQTFKAIVYGKTPQFISAPVTLILLYFSFADYPLGLNFGIALILILLAIPVVCYTYYLYVIGISTLHDITRFRAFAAVFLIPFGIVMSVVIFFAILAFFSAIV